MDDLAGVEPDSKKTRQKVVKVLNAKASKRLMAVWIKTVMVKDKGEE